MDKSAYPTLLCRLLFAIVAKWSINAHLGKWWEENNDDFLLANVSTHVRKEGKKLGKKQVEGIRYHGIQRTFDFYAVVSNACKYDRSSRRKKIYFLFSPLLFVGKRKVSVFDLYSISRIKRTNTRAQALLPGKQKKSRKCHGVDMYVIFSSPQKLKILGCKVSICSTFSLPRRQGGCFDFYCFLTHRARPLSLATCKCKDKLTTHYTSHYAPQFATPPYPFPSGIFSQKEQIHTRRLYYLASLTKVQNS